MSLIIFLIVGLIAGFIARAVVPGSQNMGIVPTLILGVVGSLLAGAIGSLINGGDFFTINPAGIIGSIIGAIVVLLIYIAVRRRTAA